MKRRLFVALSLFCLFGCQPNPGTGEYKESKEDRYYTAADRRMEEDASPSSTKHEQKDQNKNEH